MLDKRIHAPSLPLSLTHSLTHSLPTRTHTQVTSSIVLNVGAVFFAVLVASFAALANPQWLYTEGDDDNANSFDDDTRKPLHF